MLIHIHDIKPNSYQDLRIHRGGILLELCPLPSRLSLKSPWTNEFPDCNTLYYEILNHLHQALNQALIMWLSQILIIPKPNSIEFESNSGSKSRKLTNWISKFLSWVGVSSRCNQETLNQISSILKNFTQILPNSIKFQTLELPQFIIQILSGILKSSNKESCSLFNSLQIHILFANFGAW
jgi:hypothetical protein